MGRRWWADHQALYPMYLSSAGVPRFLLQFGPMCRLTCTRIGGAKPQLCEKRSSHIMVFSGVKYETASLTKRWQLLRLSGLGDRERRNEFQEYRRLFIFRTQQFVSDQSKEYINNVAEQNLTLLSPLSGSQKNYPSWDLPKMAIHTTGTSPSFYRAATPIPTRWKQKRSLHTARMNTYAWLSLSFPCRWLLSWLLMESKISLERFIPSTETHLNTPGGVAILGEPMSWFSVQVLKPYIVRYPSNWLHITTY